MTSITKNLIILLFFCVFFLYSASNVFAAGFFSVSQGIQNRLEIMELKNEWGLKGIKIGGDRIVSAFYRQREYAPLWMDDNGPVSSADRLASLIRNASLDALNPDDYHLDLIVSLIRDFKASGVSLFFTDPQKIADLDLLLTDAFLLYAFHLSEGRVDPVTLHPRKKIPLHASTLLDQLRLALIAGNIDHLFESLCIRHDGYKKLKIALARYRELSDEANFPHLRRGPSLKKGDTDDRVFVVRKILDITGDLEFQNESVGDIFFFDDHLEKSVVRFQKRHGLEADGHIGKMTQEAMGISLKERIRAIEINMERWRWIPHDLGHRYIWVNIADFTLFVEEENRTVMDMRVIVGNTQRQTPVFSARMTYLVVNPYWYIPRTIAIEDLLPKIKKDPFVLDSMNIRVFENWQSGGKAIESSIIDWSAIGRHSFPYQLRQDPGPHNSLGQFKFIFPNSYSVYLHDTPNRSLFDQTRRAFSSGCIRVEEPKKLAEYLLKTKWMSNDVENMLASSRHHILSIPEPINVHLLYLTAWVDGDGKIQFRSDIYKKDAVLDVALQKKKEEKSVFRTAVSQFGQ